MGRRRRAGGRPARRRRRRVQRQGAAEVAIPRMSTPDQQIKYAMTLQDFDLMETALEKVEEYFPDNEQAIIESRCRIACLVEEKDRPAALTMFAEIVEDYGDQNGTMFYRL
ncbi:MAG: hypothetical protein AAB254_09960, partial [candidate division NC10 bacterium]